MTLAASAMGLNWVCPKCRGALHHEAERVTCDGCGTAFPVVAEIPDLRCDAPAWIDFETDRRRALALDRAIAGQGLEAALEAVFRDSRGLEPEKAAYRARQVISGAEKCEAQLGGWLSEVLREPCLEIGTGPGQFVVAGARRGVTIRGIDVSLEWLVVAKHWVRQAGGEPVLAAALAERLPLGAGSIGSVVALDVLEHVGDQAALFREVARVLVDGGRFGMVTPNRFSLAPEPHVGVWGVGYIPVRLQARWVGLFSRHSYKFTRLLSVGEVRRLVRATVGADPAVTFPPIAEEEIALFGRGKARLARLYNRGLAVPAVAAAMPFVGAFYRVVGQKRASAAPAAAGST